MASIKQNLNTLRDSLQNLGDGNWQLKDSFNPAYAELLFQLDYEKAAVLKTEMEKFDTLYKDILNYTSKVNREIFIRQSLHLERLIVELMKDA